MEKEENKKLPSTKKLDVIKKTPIKKKVDKIDDNIIVEKSIIVKQEINIQPTIRTLKDIYQQYVLDGTPYKIYLKGQLIFNSVNHKDNPKFYDDHFILFGNKYIYKGIRFEKY